MNIIVYGSEGTMGRVLQQTLTSHSINYFRVDPHSEDEAVFKSLNDVPPADVLIDFSHHSQAEIITAFAIKRKLPIVIATTGHDEAANQLFLAASQHIPVFKSANMSFGINVIHQILKDYTALLEDDYDIEITEKHHRKKIDAPSGTAYLLADSINAGSNQQKSIVTSRSGNDTARTSAEIGIAALRGGTIVGEHTILFAGEADTIEITHHAQSKALFSEGALKAAHYIITKSPGFYTMDNLIEERKGS